MFHPVSAFVGLRYAKASKSSHFIAFINLFSVVGIALGLIALITVSSIMNGFEAQLKTRMLGITPHILVAADAPVSAAKLRQINGVRAVSPMVETEGVIQSRRGIQGVLIHGIEPEFMQTHSVLAKHMLFGQLTALRPGAYNIVIGRALANQLDLRPGDQTRLITAGASTFTPFGRMPSQRLFTIVGIFDLASQLDDKVVYMHLDDSAKLLRKATEQVSQQRLFLHDAFDYQQVERHISAPSVNWRSRQGPLFDAVKMEKNMMSLMLLLIIAVAAFNIVSALVMVVTEKQGDIAILRTQGMQSRQILSIFLTNGLYNGVKGTLIGLLAGLLLVTQINPLLSLFNASLNFANGQGLPVDIQWSQILSLVSLSIGLCFIATLYPAWRALKVEPATALKYE